MICSELTRLEQELASVREDLFSSFSDERRQREDELCVAIKDHKMLHNSGLRSPRCEPKIAA
jgi:hypothetical protein